MVGYNRRLCAKCCSPMAELSASARCAGKATGLASLTSGIAANFAGEKRKLRRVERRGEGGGAREGRCRSKTHERNKRAMGKRQHDIPQRRFAERTRRRSQKRFSRQNAARPRSR